MSRCPGTSHNLLQAFLKMLIAITVLFAPTSVGAQSVVTDLSQRNVAIEWDFRGAKILLFGALDFNQDDPVKQDIVIVVQGPKSNLLARKKSRIAGIWVNADSEKFHNIPGYYSVVSTRPLVEITTKENLAALELGLDFIQTRFRPANSGKKDDEAALPDDIEKFQQAIVRIFKNEGLYKEDPDGITVVGDRLFRTNISLPANIPVGRFTANIFVFREGELVSRQISSIHINKQGIERSINALAYDYPFFYGVFCVLVALSAGLGASFLTGRR